MNIEELRTDCLALPGTYQLFADTNIADVAYNAVEVSRKVDDGWLVVHSPRSFFKPMDFDWAHSRKI